MSTKKVRAIAFYLPQFYPTPENDEWWEPGFTEWTNVARAKPLFKGHYQPRIPRDLGFYDLRVPETREKQAQLAKDAGIEGFCYWHYWFGNGKRLLDRVFREVVESSKPDFPFCLCWANHSWYSKTWDPNKPDKLLIEQTYPGKDDYIAHFYAMLPAFKDNRYIKVNGKLLFGVFESHMVPDFQVMKDTWNQLAIENGLEGFCFFAYVQGEGRLQALKEKINVYDKIVFEPLLDIYNSVRYCRKERWKHRLYYGRFKIPHLVDYEYYVQMALNAFYNHKEYWPTIDPDFDHSPRSAHNGIILHNSTPEKWRRIVDESINLLQNRPYDDRLLFIKAWNEWGEGNYLEPDSRWESAYLDEFKKANL